MTSNIGSHIIQERLNEIKTKDRVSLLDGIRKEVVELMRQSIRPEFLNRIDEIIMFTPLIDKEVTDIVRLQIGQVKKRLEEADIDLDVTDDAVEMISRTGFDPQYGARPVKRLIQKEILNSLSKSILANSIDKNKPVILDREGDKLVFKNE